MKLSAIYFIILDKLASISGLPLTVSKRTNEKRHRNCNVRTTLIVEEEKHIYYSCRKYLDRN